MGLLHLGVLLYYCTVGEKKNIEIGVDKHAADGIETAKFHVSHVYTDREFLARGVVLQICTSIATNHYYGLGATVQTSETLYSLLPCTQTVTL